MKPIKPFIFSSAIVCGTFCFAWFVVLPAQFPNLKTGDSVASQRLPGEKLDLEFATQPEPGNNLNAVANTTTVKLLKSNDALLADSKHKEIRRLVAAENLTHSQSKAKSASTTSSNPSILASTLRSDSTGGNANQATRGHSPDPTNATHHAGQQVTHPDLQIPNICTAELPGLDFEKHQKSLVAIRDEIRKNKLAQEFAQNRLGGTAPNSPSNQLAAVPNQSQGATDQISAINGQANSQPGNSEPQASSIPVTSPLPAVTADQFNPHAGAAMVQNVAYLDAAKSDVDPHLATFSRTAFPAATECKTCHEQIYREWSMSSHAYAAVSPMFQKFEQRINDLAQGTIGYFCMRCHAPVATTMELRRDQPIWDGPRVFREGVTCVACHRVVQAHGKDNGERRMEPGDISQPVVGAGKGEGVEIAKKNSQFFKIKTDPTSKAQGQVIHRRSIQFDQLSKSTFCVSCHQVAVEPGIALEVVWNQYRASPAWREGITCQDCHMGRVPGLAEGYSVGPAAVIDGKAVTPDRKHSNHQFYGPGYSIAHPGIFPQNPDADKWTFNEWLQFDWRAGWGLEKFEEELEQGLTSGYFPPVWSDPEDRIDAREIVDDNLKLLGYKRELRRQVMVNGAKVEGPYFIKPPKAGAPLKFRYKVTNTNLGHNMPSGSLGAQPQLWLNVVLIGPNGNRLWESGYLDSVGDLADNHSADVLARKIPHDAQLFNLQTKFLTTNVKGTDREMYLPVNVDFDQLPFIRPDARPVTVMNHPPFIRMEGHSIAATGSRNAKYKIPAALMSQPGCYRLSVRMRSRMEPIYFMKDVRATPEMIQAMNEGILDVHTYSKTFIVR